MMMLLLSIVTRHTFKLTHLWIGPDGTSRLSSLRRVENYVRKRKERRSDVIFWILHQLPVQTHVKIKDTNLKQVSREGKTRPIHYDSP